MNFSAETFLIAKAFYNIHKSKQYLDAVKLNRSIAPHARHFLNQLINKLDWCMSERNSKLGNESRNIFRQEITNADTLQFDAVFDLMISMSPAQRDAVEDFAKNIAKKQTA